MPIDRFSKFRFEQALPKDEDGNKLWHWLGFINGEHVYVMYIPNTNKRVVIRSSIQGNELAAPVGGDSIRHWVEYKYRGQWHPLTKGEKQYTTRVPGWEQRLTEALRELWKLALADSKGHVGHKRVTTKPNVANIRSFCKSFPDHPVALAWSEMLQDIDAYGADYYTAYEFEEAKSEAMFEVDIYESEWEDSISEA